MGVAAAVGVRLGRGVRVRVGRWLSMVTDTGIDQRRIPQKLHSRITTVTSSRQGGPSRTPAGHDGRDELRFII
jgi:hypothetical protein